MYVAQGDETCKWSVAIVGDSGPTAEQFFTGSGVLAFSIPANGGTALSIQMTVAETPVTITQAALTCVTSVSPSSLDYPAETRWGHLTVTTPPDCKWAAATYSPFISIDQSSATTGSASLRFRIDSNTKGGRRTGAIQVGPFTVGVQQQGPTGGSFLSFVADENSESSVPPYFMEMPTSTVAAVVDQSLNHVTVQVVGSDGESSVRCWLALAAPKGQQLVPGTYENATRYPFQAPTVPGMDFDVRSSGCNELSGRFVVTEAVYGAGGTVERFHATFERRCQDYGRAYYRGEILFYR